MSQEERIANMTRAINQAIKVMGDRFGSTEEDVARTIQALKLSTQTAPQEKPVPIGAASQA
ncbi:MAG: hypothetical protein K0S58_118 [Nitrospira sp.]|jgi:hypothetical protein|nr:hypothetical protein [Nitrospira sp.]